MQGLLQSLRAAIAQEHATERLGLTEKLELMDCQQLSEIARRFPAADPLSRIQCAGRNG